MRAEYVTICPSTSFVVDPKIHIQYEICLNFPKWLLKLPKLLGQCSCCLKIKYVSYVVHIRCRRPRNNYIGTYTYIESYERSNPLLYILLPVAFSTSAFFHSKHIKCYAVFIFTSPFSWVYPVLWFNPTIGRCHTRSTGCCWHICHVTNARLFQPRVSAINITGN